MITEEQFLEKYPKHEIHYNDLRINHDHFKTSDCFWDCNCLGEGERYIHNKKETLTCIKCGAHENEQADSRINEIILHQKNINLTLI